MNRATLISLAIVLAFTGVAAATAGRDGASALALAGLASASEPLQPSEKKRVDGGAALALASIVAAASPLLSPEEKEAVAAFFSGNRNFPYNKQIHVVADKIDCRLSNVDITSRSCELTFGNTVKSLSGRAAAELFAAEGMARVPGEGAAGTIYEGLSKLRCTLDPKELKDAGGGGVACTYEGSE
jgi:hypothetical protein